jgi:hypothetical protein
MPRVPSSVLMKTLHMLPSKAVCWLAWTSGVDKYRWTATWATHERGREWRGKWRESVGKVCRESVGGECAKCVHRSRHLCFEALSVHYTVRCIHVRIV